MDTAPTGFDPDEERRKQHEFIEGAGEIRRHEKGDFEPLVGQKFSLVGPGGKSPVELFLDDIESLPENVLKRRKNVRRFPFILEFTAPDDPLLPEGTYKVSPNSDPRITFLLFIKKLDHIADEQLMVYESVVN